MLAIVSIGKTLAHCRIHIGLAWMRRGIPKVPEWATQLFASTDPLLSRCRLSVIQVEERDPTVVPDYPTFQPQL